MLIALLENNLSYDGEKYSIRIPAALRPYMGGKEVITQD
jgi:seryl-tRNA synthetase